MKAPDQVEPEEPSEPPSKAAEALIAALPPEPVPLAQPAAPPPGTVPVVEHVSSASIQAANMAGALTPRGEAMEHALRQCRVLLAGHGFAVGFIDAVLGDKR